MNKKNLKYCLYYKGEDRCPEGDYKTFQRFWYMEREYYMGSDFERRSAQWSGYARTWFNDKPTIRNFITDKRWNDVQRGFLVYCACMPPALPPEWILDYGRKN